MISYIIIGRNEGWKLERCFQSVKKTVDTYKSIPSEVIYVDSRSTDNSLEIAAKFPFVTSYLLTGDFNAAIGRNLGAENARGKILFFIDGDMEIESSFPAYVLDKKGNLQYDFTGGYHIGNYYDESWSLLYSRRYPPARDREKYFEASTGGLFMITRKLWTDVGGMKEYMEGGEDPDLALRLAKMGYLKAWVDRKMAVHHTMIDYRNAGYHYFLTKRSLSGRVLLYRENLFSKYAWKKMLRSEYMALILSVSPILLIISIQVFIVSVSLYTIASLFKALYKFKHIKQFPLLIFKDLVFILGFIFYWPSRKVNVDYEKIENIVSTARQKDL